MDYDYSELVAQAKNWGKQLSVSGWMSEPEVKALLDYDARTPDSLLSSITTRPLIVAFMGGTGVGKSSLLNRMAGKSIAKTGVERPTSREVTLYHHHSINLEHLPESLPVEKIKLAPHDVAERKNIIWIDMPDFDSTEQSNKHMVLEWLPHIDVLVYVVSPERYRDNKAWRLLLTEIGRHAWVFVLNQWDRGLPEQYDDFIRQLAKAGFNNPIVYRTSCLPMDSNGNKDEFTSLQTSIESLATEHNIGQIEARGIQVRKNHLKQTLQNCLDQFGQDTGFEQLIKVWQTNWSETARVLHQGLEWPLQRMAVYYTEFEANMMPAKNPEEPSDEQQKPAKLGVWDDWAQNRFDDTLDKIVLKADQYQIPVTPVKQVLLPFRDKAAKIIKTQTELAVRQALVNPGNAIQRWVLKFAFLCEIFLPLFAMGWVGYQVFYGFYDSSLSDKMYLGVDFAVHSVLLIAMSWLLPYFIQRKLKPSLEKVALNGLKKGLLSGMALIELEIETALTDMNRQKQLYASQATEIMELCAEKPDAQHVDYDSTLTRMLIE